MTVATLRTPEAPTHGDVFYDRSRNRLHVYVDGWAAVTRRCGNCRSRKLQYLGPMRLGCPHKWTVVNPGWFGCEFYEYDLPTVYAAHFAKKVTR